MINEEDYKELIIEYDKYIQEANDLDYYSQGWKPVSIVEFYHNDFVEILEGKEEFRK